MCRSVSAYRITLTSDSLSGVNVFLASYYGDRVTVLDSAICDADGTAVFEGDSLSEGLYTLIAPGRYCYDLLMSGVQHVSIGKTVQGSPETNAYASYLAWIADGHERQAIVAYRDSLIERFPNTFLSVYLSALQPVEMPKAEPDSSFEHIHERIAFLRQHFFDSFDLSDPRLLHTPLYAESLNYYFSLLISQETDNLIIAANGLLQKASGNDETYSYMLDYLIDCSLRRKVDGIERLHRFLLSFKKRKP